MTNRSFFLINHHKVKMHGCMNSRLVYGWPTARNEMLDEDWVCNNKIEEFVVDVSKMYANEFFYGLRCELDYLTGRVTISAKNKKLVEAAHKKSGSDLALGYRVVMTGDYERPENHTIINPDEIVVEEEEEENEEETKNNKRKRK